MQQPLATERASFVRGLNALGVTEIADLDTLWKLLTVRDGIDPGETIDDGASFENHFAILLRGVACSASFSKEGRRQIHTFHYPGDFIDLHRFLFLRSRSIIEVNAVTRCSIGKVDRGELENVYQRHPALGRALWGAVLLEMSIFRQRLAITRLGALQRVAHLLCEQMARLGVEEGVIPLSQIDVADAAGLSAVHANRMFQELRKLGVLSRQRSIRVVNKERLQQCAAFDGHYLDLKNSLAGWDLSVEE